MHLKTVKGGWAMFAEEWPLMTFTLLSQLAVGSYVILMLIRTLLNSKKATVGNQLTDQGMKQVGWVMALALVFSLFHLGTPSGAYRSLYHLGASWLSREILTAGGFFALWLVGFVSMRKGKFSQVLGWVTALAGLAAIYSMASIYATSIRPSWTNLNTYFAFFGATFAMGTAGALSFLTLNYKGSKISQETLGSVRKISWLSLISVFVMLFYLPIMISSLNGGGAAAQASAKLLTGSYLLPLVLRAILSIGGALLLSLRLGKSEKMANALSPQTIYLALLLIFVGEFVARYVFYATAVSITVGMM